MGDDTTPDRLAEELAQVREQRRRLAADLGGEDPDDPDLGDRGDAAFQLERLDDLARLDRRIAEIERLLAEPGGRPVPGLPDGAVATLRFPDGDVATIRIVSISAPAADDQGDVATAGSPLAEALVGKSVGDTITYDGPDGELQAEVVAVCMP